MATGFSAANLANKILDHLRGGTAWTQPGGLYVKLHTGDPGASGTANAAGNTTRVQSTFGTAASGGSIANTVQAQWTSYTTAETLTHFSIWDASSAGNFLWSGALTASKTMAIGDTLTEAVGALVLTLTPIAA
jgi:hypothetical protein